MTKTSAWRPGNVPVPPAHVVGLAVAVLLQRMSPRRPPPARWAVAVALVVTGAALAAASVRAAGDVRLARPDRLVTTGPYATIRHPMYAAWALIHLGAGFAAGSRWSLLTAPAAAAVVHVEATAEEQRLLASFPVEVDRYRATTPAYLPRRRRQATTPAQIIGLGDRTLGRERGS